MNRIAKVVNHTLCRRPAYKTIKLTREKLDLGVWNIIIVFKLSNQSN